MFIMVLTSAKSILISPATVMRSDMPWTPCLSTSSAIRNASIIGVFLSMISRSCWLGSTISVSATSMSLAIPSSAISIFRSSSKWKGLVTTPTVRAPISLATEPTTGAAPVPVPPPMPAVMNTISEPCSSSNSLSLSSRAAFSPTSGSAPAPSPLVRASPI